MHRARQLFSLLLALSIAAFIVPEAALATSAGSPDTGWGGTGMVDANIGFGTQEAAAVATQSDGKVLVGGNYLPESSFRLARYLADGTLDTTFGTAGFANAPDFGIGHGGTVRSIVVEPGGRIVVAVENKQNDSLAWIAAFLPNGNLDTAFAGGAGFTTLSSTIAGTGFNILRVSSLLRDDSGNFYVVGSGHDVVSTNYEIWVRKVASDGTIPGTSNYVGVTAHDEFAGGASFNAAGDEIVVAGSDVNGGTRNTALTYFNAPGLGSHLVTVLDMAQNAGGQDGAYALLPNGTGFLLGGYQTADVSGDQHAYVARVSDQPFTIDAGFGSGGMRTFEPGPDPTLSYSVVTGLAALSNGSFLASTQSATAAGAGRSYLARIGASGTLETAFGNSGIAPLGGDNGMLFTTNALLYPVVVDGQDRALVTGQGTITGGQTVLRTWRSFATQGDLAVSATRLDAAALVPGVSVHARFTLTNTGADRSLTPGLSLTLPTGATLVSASPSSGTCALGICTFGALASGASATVDVTATLTSAGSYALNGAATTTTTPNTNAANDTGTLTLVVRKRTGVLVLHRTVHGKAQKCGATVKRSCSQLTTLRATIGGKLTPTPTALASRRLKVTVQVLRKRHWHTLHVRGIGTPSASATGTWTLRLPRLPAGILRLHATSPGSAIDLPSTSPWLYVTVR